MAYSNTDWSKTTLPEKMRNALDGMEEGIEERLKKDGSEAMDADLPMGGHKVVNVQDPTADQDAATKKYVDDGDAKKVNLDGSSTMQGDLVMGGHEVTGLPEVPTKDNAAASKKYVDTEVQEAKDAVLEHYSEADGKFLNKKTGGSMEGPIDMNQNKISDLPAPTEESDAARLADVNTAKQAAIDDAATKYVKKSGDTMSGPLNMGGNPINGISMTDSSNTQSAVNKGYVDEATEDLQQKINELTDAVTGVTDGLANSGKLGTEIYVTHPAGAYEAGDRISAETDVATALYDMLCRPTDPVIEKQPSATISVKDLALGTAQIETGTTVTAAWSVDLDPGAYSFKSQTRQTVDGEAEYVVVDGTGVEIQSVKVFVDGSAIYESSETSVETSGEYALPQPLSDTGVVFSTTIGHTQGNVALTNIETVPLGEEPLRIAAGEVSGQFTLKGYRKMFYGAVTENTVDGSVVRQAVTSAVIRGLQQGIKPDKSAHTFTAPAGSTKVIIAFPKAYTTNKPKVEMMTLSWEDYSSFFNEVSGGVQVADARGGSNGLVDYIVYTYEFNAISAATQFRVTLK